MLITKKLFSKTLLSVALIGFSGLVFANDIPMSESKDMQSKPLSKGMKILLQEPGGLRYSPQAVYPKYSSMENANMGGKSVQIERESYNSPHDNHLKEHGGQIYQTTKLKNEWMVDEDGKGNLEKKFQTLIRKDENCIKIKKNL